SLDIGSRQTNRSDAPSVIACEAGDRAAILTFLATHWGRQAASHDGFGQGTAAERFVALLGRPDFWDVALQKSFHD
ncbi:MAG: UDP-N-acetylglucosamine 2-epimerase (hydrolyzing), partial [Rhizobiales bacterium 17-65-6]